MEVVTLSSAALALIERDVGLSESELMDQDQARANALVVLERDVGPLSPESAVAVLAAVDGQYSDDLAARVHEWLECRIGELAGPGPLDPGRYGGIVAGVAGALVSDMWARGTQDPPARLEGLRSAWIEMFDSLAGQLCEMEGRADG